MLKTLVNLFQFALAPEPSEPVKKVWVATYNFYFSDDKGNKTKVYSAKLFRVNGKPCMELRQSKLYEDQHQYKTHKFYNQVIEPWIETGDDSYLIDSEEASFNKSYWNRKPDLKVFVFNKKDDQITGNE